MSDTKENYLKPDVRYLEWQMNLSFCQTSNGTEDLVIDGDEGEWD